MKNLLTLLLILLPLFLSAQNIAVKSFKKAPNDMTARVTHPLTDQNGEKCAVIKMVTTQKGFVFEGDMMGITKTEYKTGEYWIYLPNGASRITIKHNKLGILRNYHYPISIKEATVYIMELTTGTVTTTVEAYEIPMQWLTITSEPDGGDVFINNKFVGTTPYAKKMQVGKYNYRVESYMYHNNAGAVTLTGDNKEALNITLKPNFGYAKVATTPENGAKIEIDGRPVNGVTPFTTEKLLSGKHSIRIKKAMYNTKTVDFEITDGQTTNLTIPLEANFATITVETTPTAAIYIDDEYKAEDSYTGRVMPGLHSIEAKIDNYRPDKKQVEFTAGETPTITLYPVAITGKADIVTTPFDAAIDINGKDYGTTPNTIKNILIGTYTLTLTKQGYGTITKTITIEENKTTTINETLPSGKEVTINSTPQGAAIYIDGQNRGTTPHTETLSFANHTIKLVNGKKTVEQTITVSQTGETVWSFDVRDKGTFTDKRDGETYKWVRIGNQIWMAENLRYASGKYITDDSEWGDLEDNNYDAAYCWYDNNKNNKKRYGALYTYAAAIKACPDGWHLPSDKEWTTLENYIKNDGHSGSEGAALKSTTGWNDSGSGTDNYGFYALPGGYRSYYNGTFGNVGYYGFWWSSTECSSSVAYNRSLLYGDATVRRNYANTSDGFSVRCLRD